MPEIPDCLNRRYQALDELIRELSSLSYTGSEDNYSGEPGDEAGIKLMCDFWNILKEDPDCNLTQAVRQRMGLSGTASRRFHPHHVTCYMACCNNSNESRKKSPADKSPEQKTPSPRGATCCSSKSVSPKSTNEAVPLSKVLCNLKEAVSFDKKCNVRIGELMLAEKQLQEQIQHLEHREKEGIQMLKQADCMWSCMEEAYKKKVAESLERQSIMLKQMKEVETSNTKWRKNKKDLEFQLNNINKCYLEIKEKINEKTSDITCIKMEIENFKKKIASNKKDTDAVNKSFGNKKTASNAKVASLAAEMTKLKQLIADENEYKAEKEYEGSRYVKEARDDLQKICKVLLQKKLENEDLRAEKEALLEEILILRKTCDQCKDKCKNKQQFIIDEIAKVNDEIAGFRVRCIRCHECTDTADVRKFCTDCPRCAEERECLYEDSHCFPDAAADCVCMSTKQKFLDNVFENMYTVLERQAKTCPGKAVAEQVLNCLKRSRNGKLNEETRKNLQDFVLTTVKKNLNLTIIGGAVKTRCELDPDTYKQLMLCLKQVKTVKAPKVDKATGAKKDPCRRWGGASECNCPKGPKACICTKKAPPPPNDPDPCPPPDKEDAGEVTVCPHKDSTACGPDCAMHAVPSSVGTEVASWRPAPCDEKHCNQFTKNMRAAQCVLGPDSLSSVSKSKGSTAACPMPDIAEIEDQITCKCRPEAIKPCVCRKDLKSHPRERIIEEVMGRYTDVTPIEKVTNMDKGIRADSNKGRNKNRCSCLNFPIKKSLRKRTSEHKTTRLCACTSSYFLPENNEPYCKRLCQRKQVYICRSSKGSCAPNENDFCKMFPGFQFQYSKRCIIGLKDGITIAVLTSPKHRAFRLVDKSVGSSHVKKSCQKYTEDVTKNTSKSEQLSAEDSNKDKSIQNSGITLFGRTVCDTVKELIKDVIVSDVAKARSESVPSDVEWITIESFLKEICSLTRSKHTSDSTINEVEIASELLSDTNMKLNTKDNIINMLTLPKAHIASENCFLSMKDKMTEVINYLFVSKSYGDSPLISNATSNESIIRFSNIKDHSCDEKHLKVDVDQCNQGTCAMIWDQAKEENNKVEKDMVSKEKILETKDSRVLVSKKRKEEKTKIKDKPSREQENRDKVKKMPSKQTITKRACLENKNVTFSGTHSDPKVHKNKCSCEDHYKLTIENDNGQSNQFTKLSNTPSGSLEMELDENIIKQIKQKMVDSNKITVSLKRSESGHLQVDFSPCNNSSNNIQNISVIRTSTGSLVFEVNKSFVSILKPDIIIDKKKLELDNNSSISVSITPRKQQKKIIDKNSQKAENMNVKNACRVKSHAKLDIAEDKNTKETKQKVERRNSKDVIIKIKEINGSITAKRASLIKKEAGNIAFLVNDTSSSGILEEMLDKCKEHPIFLNESDSGSYVIDFQSEKSNAMIQKTRSGKIMIVKVDPVVKFMETNETFCTKKCDDVFKISVTNSQQKLATPPFVLKSTPSDNYIVVVDKEYETRYRKTIKDHLDSDYECPVELVKTPSENYVLNFEESGVMLNANARLVRSESGNIKIVKTLPGSNRLSIDSKSVSSNVRSQSKVLDDLINTLPTSSKDKPIDIKPRLIETKSSSDSNLYEKVKIRLQNRQHLLSEPSALLKKTSSGQYAVVLNKESKKSFINNLKSYLASNSQDLIPIKRTESGEITIILNNDSESKGEYGSLKITPSGNIYVLVDEKVIETMTQHVKLEKPTTSLKAQQEIDYLQNPVDKNITTTCNAFPDNCSCEASKCVCAELLKHVVDTNDSGCRSPKFMFCKQKDEDIRRNKLKCNYKNCDCEMCPNSCMKRFDDQRDKPPHIVIKSCGCTPEPQKKVIPDNRPLYYVTEEVCPFHKNRYDSVSNELLEISGLCNNNDEQDSKQVYEEDNEYICINQAAINDEIPLFRRTNLDYLDFLPPQLPPFLRDYRCA